MAKDSAKAKGALEAYRHKRDPARTNEPFSAERKSSGATLRGRFVVHLHAATRRHYDLRLEVGGRLLSFAVPHGPSLDPNDKRLAVRTEDHPIDYLDFEDVIPAGNYGAGAMIVWDTGTVIYLEGSAEDGIDRGKIDFNLQGHKLRGRYGLVHTGARKRGSSEENHWLLLKKRDAYASEEDIAASQPLSVLSGLAVEELADSAAIAAALEEEAAALGAKKRELKVAKLTPMLCAISGAELDEAERFYELKLDGVRIVADKNGDRVDLRYRKLRSATRAYPEIARAVAALPCPRLVLDGEIVAFDDAGRPSFQRLARRIHLSRPRDVELAQLEVPVSYLVFDLLQIGAYDLTPLPLSARKQLLAKAVPGRGLVRMLDHVAGDGRALYDFCREHGLEGVVAKQRGARYRPGPRRTSDWVKIKIQREGDFVVVGWEESAKKSRKLRSLLLAAHDGDGELILRGKAGSGLDESTIDWFLAELAADEVSEPSASGEVTSNGPRHWVTPRIVVNIEYHGLSDSGALRFPVFRGVREDLNVEDCVLVTADEALSAASERQEEARTTLVRADQVAVRVKLTNQDKVFWPAEGFTKGDLCNYYAAVAEVAVPFLRGRPIVMVRYPDGIAGKSFYQWHVPKGTPDWIRSLEVREEGERGKSRKRTFLIDDIDGLLFIANLGCIPIHVLAAHEGSRELCDFLTIDFDLGGQPFRDAVTLAMTLREMLTELGLKGFPKTSGQSGLHVLIPMGDAVPFTTAKVLVELLGRLLEVKHHDIATTERVKNKRGSRVYIDTGQTGRSRTIVAPYSVRAVAGAGVSTPLRWDELHAALDPRRFDMFTVPERVATVGDPMAGMLDERPDVAEAIRRLETMIPR